MSIKFFIVLKNFCGTGKEVIHGAKITRRVARRLHGLCGIVQSQASRRGRGWGVDHRLGKKHADLSSQKVLRSAAWLGWCRAYTRNGDRVFLSIHRAMRVGALPPSRTRRDRRRSRHRSFGIHRRLILWGFPTWMPTSSIFVLRRSIVFFRKNRFPIVAVTRSLHHHRR